MPTMRIFVNGTVHVMDGLTPAAEAIVVSEGRVVGVGAKAAMERLAGVGAERIDLHGATLMPGLIDTHPHLLHFGAFAFPLVDLAAARDHADIVARLAARAAETPTGQWVMATPVGEAHYFLRRSYRDLAEGELPDRHVLDRATSSHPLLIQAWAPVTPNVCALNSAGLAALGINRDTPDRVANVWIEKDAHGEPSGRLRGSVNNYYSNDPFMNELLRQVPMLDPAAVLPGTAKAMGEYNRMGVTAVYEGHAMGLPEIGAYQALRQDGLLTLRVLTALEVEPYGLPWSRALTVDEVRETLEQSRAMTSLDDELLRHDGVTLSRGGPCWPGFLRMHEPYRGPYGELTRGVTFVEEEKERLALEYCAAEGVRLNFIGAGDRDHDEFLANAEAVAHRHDLRERGWILQHAFFVSEVQARRYAALGFRVTTSMSFSWAKGDLFGERMGPEVWADLIPLRRLLDAGLVVGCGTDWGPKNVFEHIELAQTHRFAVSGRQNLGPAQAVGREEAVRMWTRDAARALGWEGIGTLRQGDHADLIVVDRDPLACRLEDLAATKVLLTALGGRPVFDAEGLAEAVPSPRRSS